MESADERAAKASSKDQFALPPQLQRAMDARQDKLKQKIEKSKHSKDSSKENRPKSTTTKPKEKSARTTRPFQRPNPAPASKPVSKPTISSKQDNSKGTSKRPVKSKGACVSEIERIQQNRESRRKAAQHEQRKLQAELDEHGDAGVENIRFRRLVTKARTEAMEAAPCARPHHSSRIQVVVRKRPMLEETDHKHSYDVVSAVNMHTVVVHEPKHTVDMKRNVTNHAFCFDQVFDETATNADVYEGAVGPLVNTLLNTTNARVTCFAYGQTGSGKTYTMSSMLKLALNQIFESLSPSINLGVSFFEVYMAKAYDCLADRCRLEVQEDHLQNVQVVGLTEEQAQSCEEAERIVERGFAARITRDNRVHDFSSRSHGVVQITLRHYHTRSIVAKMSLVDLAGSERASDTRAADRQTQLEGAEINKSLLALKECIRAMDNKETHIPFRGSKLSQLLKESFVGKQTRMTVLAHIGPASASTDHTLNTLRYADRCLSISAADGGLTRESSVKETLFTTDESKDSVPDYASTGNVSPHTQMDHGPMQLEFTPPHSQDQIEPSPPLQPVEETPQAFSHHLQALLATPEEVTQAVRESQLSTASIGGAPDTPSLNDTAWEQNALFKGVLDTIGPSLEVDDSPDMRLSTITPMQERVQLESPRGESCGGLMDHITVRDNSSRGKLCTSVQAEAGLRLAELHSETMSQFSQLALEEEEQLAHFATTEADCHQHYANYAKFVQDTCAKRMKLLSKLQQMSKDWLEL